MPSDTTSSNDDTLSTPESTISFQGELGAYSHMACQAKFPNMTVLPCPSFEEALEAVQNGAAHYAMIPIENSTAGRVADIHLLLPGSGLKIVDEHFQAIRHCLLARHDVTDAELKTVTSHVQALGQTRKTTRKMGLNQVPFADTAGAAHHIAQGLEDKNVAAVASKLAAEVYNLRVVKEDIQDEGDNTTRFVVLSRSALDPSTLEGPCMTSLKFEVKNLPAALYKALGGFATNGVNMTKLESYYQNDSFTATEFYAEIVGTPVDTHVARALEELQMFSRKIEVLGTYPQAKSRD